MNHMCTKIFILNVFLCGFVLGIFSNARAGDVDSPRNAYCLFRSNDFFRRLCRSSSSRTKRILRALRDSLKKSTQAVASIDELYAFIDRADTSTSVRARLFLTGLMPYLRMSRSMRVILQRIFEIRLSPC